MATKSTKTPARKKTGTAAKKPAPKKTAAKAPAGTAKKVASPKAIAREVKKTAKPIAKKVERELENIEKEVGKGIAAYNPVTLLREFLKFEASSGILLLICAAVAMVLANMPASSHWYHHLLHETTAVVGIGESFRIEKDVIHWINDGLMAIFFFLVGLEIKREVKEGLLSSRDQLMLPCIAAVGGMLVPGLIFFSLNRDNPTALSGWAIPTATDIAFAVGILSILGKRVPLALKVFLLALAIIDDLGAIVIIAVFYTQHLQVENLMLALGFLIGLFALNRAGVGKASFYAIMAAGMWWCVLKSGVHATLAGVMAAMAIPLSSKNSRGEEFSLLRQLEHDLHPLVAYVILPMFAFANAGVVLKGMSLNILWDPVTLGVIAGLFIGKQVGVFSATYLCIKLKLAAMPRGVTWGQVWGVSLLAGIGFTMSLFIGTLGYINAPLYLTEAKLGILIGSGISAVVGLLALMWLCPKRAVATRDSDLVNKKMA